ncbi:hypothetical protein STRTUCAR8_10241 [Streptomyces turgidiscabies Car8]|uniref:Uncharacterized protein n=1 Tax=Streptomyces turgidiscabies (strain Car8) TaxID=698760 RepID=L7F5W5_STRT8|nr:hypothetical protein STRTUCAR8_10241 [Streptomyces turgidiscabies Car8]
MRLPRTGRAGGGSRRVRGRGPAPLVDGGRQGGLPRRAQTSDHRGRRRLEQLPRPGLEGQPRRTGHRDGSGDQRVPPAAGHTMPLLDEGPRSFRTGTQ